MRRGLVRVGMAAVGTLSLAIYTAGAYLTYVLLRGFWANRPSAATIVLGLVALTAVIGFLTLSFGTERLIRSIGATPLNRAANPAIADRFDRLVDRMDLDPPRLLVTDLGEPNAFAMPAAVNGVIVMDRSLGDILTPDELEAVLAHELAHLEARDSLINLFAAVGLQTVMQVVAIGLFPALLFLTGVAKAAAWFRGRPGDWTRSLAWRLRTLVVVLVAILPAIFTFLLLARSRRREYAADRRAAAVTSPAVLASALRTIDAEARARLALRSLLPADAEENALARLLGTHPAMADRIAALEAMATP